ncbi:aminotransferase class V-fold PLP-dependent enzyme [Streptomyces violaceoruber]|uniref:aminotransferase class V-fold PLP-dependent enzyme n=1 Tax=Streptomyces violaceoruber TaxID=1935 RepID=UPI001F3E9F78|nr:aminotransferase class V-fold PLP-dependent enzyme [Streptomyces violaceoruber]
MVSRLLAEGALPVLSSDCVVTAAGALRILSSDDVPGVVLDAAVAPGPVRVVALTDVAGIHLTRDPQSPVLPYPDPDDVSGVRRLFRDDAWDATGAMEGKVEAVAAHAPPGRRVRHHPRRQRPGRSAAPLRPAGRLARRRPPDPGPAPYPGGRHGGPRRHRTVPGGPDMTGTTKRPDLVVLLNPGPVNVHDRVRAALAGPDECHREPGSQGLLGTVGGKITEVCGAGRDSHATVLFTGSGTAALEAALSSAVPADGRLLVLDNGHYGERLPRIADVHGIATVRLEFGRAVPLEPDAADQALAADAGITHVAVVHHETSTGMLNPLRGLGPLVARHGRSLIADAISSLGAQDLDVVRDHVDWCVGTASKCLEGMPGISFVCAPRERLEALADVPARSFCLDLSANYRAQVVKGSPRFTPAVQVLRALGAALDLALALALALAEGVAARTARYAARAAEIRAGLEERGIELLLPPERRAGSITNAHLANGDDVRRAARRSQGARLRDLRGPGEVRRGVPPRQHGPVDRRGHRRLLPRLRRGRRPVRAFDPMIHPAEKARKREGAVSR